MRAFSRWLLVVLGAATVGLNAWASYGPNSGHSVSPVDFFATTIGLFKVAYGIPETPWQLKIARYTGAVFTSIAMVKVGMALGREQIRRFQLSRCRRHVVICGLGRKGLQLASEFRRLGYTVAAADSDPKNDDLVRCRREGILFEKGDATKSETLEALRVERAYLVFAVCRDDSTNLDIAMETLERIRMCSVKGRLNMYVHLFHLPLRVLLQRHELPKRTPGFELRLFNIFENTARTLLAQHPLEGDLPSPARRVHLVVIGLTRLGEAVVTQAARVAHYSDLRPIQVTVVDEKAEIRGEDFLARQPGIEQSCKLQFCSLRFSETRFSRFEFVGEEAADEERTIVLCLEEDEENVSLALRLAERMKDSRVPILARVSEPRGLGRVLEAANAELSGKGIRTFGAIEKVCGWEVLRDEYLDQVAKRLHADYQKTHGELPDWADLSEDLRNSNRAAADHIDVKLNAIGCQRVPAKDLPSGTPAFSFSHEEIELLSRMEHRRWCADRWLSGWSLGPEKDARRKTHPNLVEWNELSEADCEKDRDQVRLIPQVLEEVDFAVRRKETERPTFRAGAAS